MSRENDALLGPHSRPRNHRDTTALQAYQASDREASRRMHEARMTGTLHYSPAELGHDSNWACHALGLDDGKAVLFAASDGVLTSFSVISAGAGAGLAWPSVLVLGLGNALATAFIQGMGEFLASRTHHNYVMQQRERELWEIDNFRRGELDEMVLIYGSKYGVEAEDAELLVNTMAKYNDLFVNVMMVEELGLMVPDGESASLGEAAVMFFFFAIFAVLPLLGYAVIPMVINPAVSDAHLFQIAVTVACVLLAVLGAVKSMYSLQRWYTAALEAFFMGGAACLIAYSIGRIAANILETTGTVVEEA